MNRQDEKRQPEETSALEPVGSNETADERPDAPEEEASSPAAPNAEAGDQMLEETALEAQSPVLESEGSPLGSEEEIFSTANEMEESAAAKTATNLVAEEELPLDRQVSAKETEPVEGDTRAWYVIHCYSGYENKVRHNLEQRIETMGMKDKIFDVVIPTQEEVEVRDGKRRVVERHVFPGYVLVNMILTEESWYVVRNTPGVTGFVGMGNQPTALRPEEVSQILKRMEAEAPHIKVTFKVGERVRIIDGPFNDFRGTVAEIDMDRTKVRVMVNFFGRETPVELDFLQVEKS